MTNEATPILYNEIKSCKRYEEEIIKQWDNFIKGGFTDSRGMLIKWSKCPLWHTPAYIVKEGINREKNGVSSYVVDPLVFSPRAGGWYFLQPWINAQSINTSLTPIQKACLTTWLVEQIKKGFIPFISDKTFEDVKKLTPMKATDKAMGFLKTLTERENTYELIKIFDSSQTDLINVSTIEVLYLYAKSEASSYWDVSQIINYLNKKGYINFPNPSDKDFIELTLEGKMATETVTNEDSDECFVAMWFDPSLNAVYKAIANGVKQAGYKPIRIDNLEHNKKIDDEIISALRRARFVVADFTHGDKGIRGSVYYEAGFAHGLGIEVIFTCHKDIVEEIHFDTRQYNHITWHEKELGNFTEQIKNRICATVGDGPNKAKQ